MGVRCLGAITRDRLEALRETDAIVREEIDKAGLSIWQYFAVVPDFRTTGVREGKRAYDWPCIIRCINTVDGMAAEVPELDWVLLKRITARDTLNCVSAFAYRSMSPGAPSRRRADRSPRSLGAGYISLLRACLSQFLLKGPIPPKNLLYISLSSLAWYLTEASSMVQR